MFFTIVPIENFPNEAAALLFNLIFLIVLIAEIRVPLKELFTKNNKTNKKSGDKGSFLLILASIILLIGTVFFLAYTKVGKMPHYLSYLGIISIISGFILRQYSISILGKFFIVVVEKQKGQKIIQKGPYKHIRHPSYTGLLLELLGVPLAVSNWIGLIVAIFGCIPPIIYRIRVEERFLLNNFRDYKKYMLKTKKLIPFIY